MDIAIIPEEAHKSVCLKIILCNSSIYLIVWYVFIAYHTLGVE